MAKKKVAKAPPKATGQIACGYARCKMQMNCKNSNSLLAIEEVDHKRCRTFRSHVRFVKFGNLLAGAPAAQAGATGEKPGQCLAEQH